MLMNFMNYVSAKVKNEEGQGMVEYALLVGLIALAVIVAAGFLGDGIAAQFDTIVTKIAGTVN